MVQRSQVAAAEVAPGLFLVPYLSAGDLRTRCEDAAGLLDGGWRPKSGDPFLELTVSPGLVSVARRDGGWLRSEPGPNGRPVVYVDGPWRKKDDDGLPAPKRGEVTAWSARSRNRLVQAACEREFDGCGWCMVTLTYPGDWAAVAPTPERSKRHLQAFRNRWTRRWGKPRAMWKLEFQQRGAPHYHVLVQLPEGVDVREMRAWVALAWYQIVRSGDERHLRAGTAVDARWRQWDASLAIGRYFSKHGVWSSKEYQHNAPAEWERTGRWWGTWNLPPIRERVYLRADELVALRRIARKWYRSTHPRRLVLRALETHDGRPVQRVGYVGGRLRSVEGGGQHGMFLLARDGPRLALALARAAGLATTVTTHGRDDANQTDDGVRVPDPHARREASGHGDAVRVAVEHVPRRART